MYVGSIIFSVFWYQFKEYDKITLETYEKNGLRYEMHLGQDGIIKSIPFDIHGTFADDIGEELINLSEMTAKEKDF